MGGGGAQIIEHRRGNEAEARRGTIEDEGRRFMMCVDGPSGQYKCHCNFCLR